MFQNPVLNEIGKKYGKSAARTSAYQNLTKIKPVRKMTFLRTGFCVAFLNDIYLFCN